MPAQKRGFTLVELLVVISIIAILSVVGITVFTGVQKGARDARRKEDINSIAKAMEVHYGDSSCLTNSTGVYTAGRYNYCYLLPSFFSSGTVPYDPKATGYGKDKAGSGCSPNANLDTQKSCWYCVQYPIDQTDQTNTFTYCDTNNTRHQEVAVDSPSPDNKWIICANLETGNPGYYCRRSQQ